VALATGPSEEEEEYKIKILKITVVVSLKRGPCRHFYDLNCGLYLSDHFTGKLLSIHHQNLPKCTRRLSIAAVIPVSILKLHCRNLNKDLQLVYWMKMQEEL